MDTRKAHRFKQEPNKSGVIHKCKDELNTRLPLARMAAFGRNKVNRMTPQTTEDIQQSITHTQTSLEIS